MVVRKSPPNTTVAPFTKLLPITVREKLPTVMGFGEIEVTRGMGFSTVTAAAAVLRESATLVAVTLTGLGAGNAAGAGKAQLPKGLVTSSPVSCDL